MAVPRSNVLQSYAPDAFLEWDVWKAVERILAGNGTCCGIGGSRGAGKTWLLRHAVRSARGRRGVGVYFPSPSAYDPSSFLSGLCQALASEVVTTFRPPVTPYTRLRELLRIRSIQLAGLLALLGTIGYYARGRLDSLSQAWPVYILGAALAVFYVSLPFYRSERRRSRDPEYGLYLRGLAIQRWIQYSSSSKSTSELAIEAGKGLVAKGKTSEELALSERPVTELSLVTEFRSLAEDVASQSIPVVIAIDELDKIGSVEDVRKLLRSVKGVLDPSGVVLLVSVSEEAVTHLGLAGLRGRDEISSSFAMMLEVPPLDVAEADDLIASRVGRGLPLVATTLDVVTGGNPREIVRLLEEYLNRIRSADDQLPTDEPLMCALMAAELEAREFLVGLASEPDIGEISRLRAYQWVRRNAATREALERLNVSAVLSQWDPQWGEATDSNDPSLAWPEHISEQWRRFIIRLAVNCFLREEVHQQRLSDPEVECLRSLVQVAAYSASIARYLGEEDFAAFKAASL